MKSSSPDFWLQRNVGCVSHWHNNRTMKNFVVYDFSYRNITLKKIDRIEALDNSVPSLTNVTLPLFTQYRLSLPLSPLLSPPLSLSLSPSPFL